jgi:tRNA (guanine10-N2)-methyltransferase
VKLRNAEAARILVSRSILTQSIHELWGNGSTYDDLHTNVKEATSDRWQDYMQCSFKFVLDAYQHSRSPAERREIVESFSYMGFQGPIRMKDVDETFTVFEDYEYQGKVPQRLYLGRFLGPGNRDLINTYTLKKRKYLLTTSMDSELALVMANLALASSGKLFYDPFVGSGSLPLACSHFGAYALGSDMDGRCVRGKKGVNVESSFAQYNLGMRYFGGFVADLTHCPLRDVRGGFMDGIVCDPPYGVREGLKVLGRKNGERKEIMYIEGEAAHL